MIGCLEALFQRFRPKPPFPPWIEAAIEGIPKHEILDGGLERQVEDQLLGTLDFRLRALYTLHLRVTNQHRQVTALSADDANVIKAVFWCAVARDFKVEPSRGRRIHIRRGFQVVLSPDLRPQEPKADRTQA